MVEILKIETAFFTNKWIQIYEESDHVLVVDMHFHYEEIFADSATKKMDTGIIHVVLAWIISRHIYLAARHFHTQLKLGG